MKRLLFYLLDHNPIHLSEYLRKHGGSIKLNDDTYIVHQSIKFHDYCYNQAYNEFKKGNQNG